jgi:uncharacterized repeat protein (TIGR03803 family)
MNRWEWRHFAACGLMFFTLMLAFPSVSFAAGKKATVLYSFQAHGDGAIPAGGVIFDQAGNLYGATQDGGTPGVGEVFQLKPPAKRGDPWTETIIHSFQSGSDGDIATSGVISDNNGNLYGVTEYGGSGNCEIAGQVVGCGIAYELSPPATKGGAWTETVIYSFQGGNDGDFPYGNLLLDQQGNLFGTTEYGGGSPDCSPAGPACGTVFELSPPKTKGGAWTEKVLYSFQGGSDGGYPNGQLVLDANCALDGTTYLGGNQGCSGFGMVGCGTAFELKPPSHKGGVWTEKILHRFNGGTTDGGNPWAGLIFDQKGNLYGTTANFGSGSFGTVFQLIPPAKGSHWREKLIHTFVGSSDGINPEASLTLDEAGNLYGVACCGGSPEYGTIFRLKPPTENHKTWYFKVLYSFKGSPDGASPASGLIFDHAGNLYSTTLLGGTGTECDFGGIIGCGTVFRLSPNQR